MPDIVLHALTDNFLDRGVVEMQLECFRERGRALLVLLREVFGEDGGLEERHGGGKAEISLRSDRLRQR